MPNAWATWHAYGYHEETSRKLEQSKIDRLEKRLMMKPYMCTWWCSPRLRRPGERPDGQLGRDSTASVNYEQDTVKDFGRLMPPGRP